jgi:hypothetical protein
LVDTTSQISTSSISAQMKIHVAEFMPDTRNTTGRKCGLVLRVTDQYVHTLRFTGNVYRDLSLKGVTKLMDYW